jgi:thiosulfate dehydrogenase (quinone) large subunit
VTVTSAEVTGRGAEGMPPAADRFARFSIVAMRLVLAFMWIENTRWKVPPRFGADRHEGLWLYLDDAVRHPVFAPYAWVAEHVLLPNIGVVGWGVLLAEAAIGALLLVGLLTRLAGALGALQALVIFLSVGQTPGEWPWAYYLMIVGCLGVAGIAAGRVAGVDAVLRPYLLRAAGPLHRLAVLA